MLSHQFRLLGVSLAIRSWSLMINVMEVSISRLAGVGSAVTSAFPGLPSVVAHQPMPSIN